MKQPQRSKRFGSYDDLIRYTDKPLARRLALKIGRGGRLAVPRRFHLPAPEVDALHAEWKRTKRMPNPHKSGFYFYLLEAMISLGIDKAHRMTDVMAEVQRAMSDSATRMYYDQRTAWERFLDIAPNGRMLKKKWEERFDLNVTVLQRLTAFTPYGRKLLDVGQKVMKRKGAVIDVLRADNGEKLLRLNTRSDWPRNDFKIRGHGSPAETETLRRARREGTSPR